MKADELIKGRIKNPIYAEDAWVKAFVGNKGGDWWHVHRDEEVPKGDVAIVIPLANMEDKFYFSGQ